MRVPLEKRIAGAAKVGHHKTSMLQDIEAGRSPEIDALVGSVVEHRAAGRDADAAHRHRCTPW
jgi:ketopantoate reductase